MPQRFLGLLPCRSRSGVTRNVPARYERVYPIMAAPLTLGMTLVFASMLYPAKLIPSAVRLMASCTL